MNNTEQAARVERALDAVKSEILSARAKFGPFTSRHEAYAVLLEEVDELWAEIKQFPSMPHASSVQIEAIQVAAMAVSLVVELP